MLFYRAYGIIIRSQLALPEFPAITNCQADASVVFGDGSGWIDAVRNELSFWSVQRHEARFWFKGVAGFLVRGGVEIVVSPEPGIEPSLLRMYVEGMMMACLLQQRGYYVLHASVVEIGRHGIAFLGHVGAGKSSLAAALHARGHAVVTDDNAVIELSCHEPLVIPAFPSVKVYPAIAASLGYEEHSLKVMHSSQMKRATSVSRAFPKNPVPLRRLYVLERGAAGTIMPLTPGEATVELIRNSVPTRWRQPGDGTHLTQCAQLSRLIPAARIRTFDALEEIPEIAQRIEENELERSAAAD